MGETDDQMIRFAVVDPQKLAGSRQRRELFRIKAVVAGEDKEPLSAQIVCQEKSAFLDKDNTTGQLVHEFAHVSRPTQRLPSRNCSVVVRRFAKNTIRSLAPQWNAT